MRVATEAMVPPMVPTESVPSRELFFSNGRKVRDSPRRAAYQVKAAGNWTLPVAARIRYSIWSCTHAFHVIAPASHSTMSQHL